jgi:hypothetical protein
MRLPFQTLFGAALVALVAAVCMQQAPGWWRGALSRAEVDAYLARVERQVPMPEDEKRAALQRLRAFAEADDGKPVYMLNVMRMYDHIKPLAGVPPFDGTPAQANAYYEDKVKPMLLKTGSYPLYAGETTGRNLFGYDAAQDGFHRVLVVRYPSRRAFLDLIADPAYGPVAPYKLMSLELVLAPTEVELAIPDLRLVVGALAAVLFLAAGWTRSARRTATSPGLAQ